MNAIRQIVDVEAGQIIIKLPKEYNKKQVEVIVLDMQNESKKSSILDNLPHHRLGKDKSTYRREDIYE